MNTATVSSVESLARTLSETDRRCICIERSPVDDVVPTFVEAAARYGDQGADVLIVCADAIATDRFRQAAAAYPTLAGAVVSLRELCLDILSVPGAERIAGRRPRVLSENEHNVLLEDMKASGLKPRRLREMLKFFYRSISECADEQPEWLISHEEQMVFALLEENLTSRQAILPCELSSLASEVLAAQMPDDPSRTSSPDTPSFPDSVPPISFDKPKVVFVDDFGALSVASQRLIDRIAQERLIVAGSTLPARCSEEPYPHPAGLRACAEQHVDSLLIALETDTSTAEETYTVFDSPEEELSSIADSIAACLEAGMNPRDILAAVPNDTWAARLAEELDSRKVAVDRVASSDKIKGDPRKPGRFADLKLATFFKLVRDPHDLVSLRSWLGLGDWLMRSDAYLELMAYASERGMDIESAIASLRALPAAERPTTVFDKFDGPLDELERLTSACSDIARDEAIALFAENGMPLSPSMIALLGEDDGPVDIATLAHDAFASTPPDGVVDAVLVVPFSRCHGRRADTVFLMGLVNGFLPATDAVDDRHTIDHRTIAIERDRVLFDDIRTLALKQMFGSSFSVDRLERAAKLDIQTTRIFIRGDVQYARIAPSEFITASN